MTTSNRSLNHIHHYLKKNLSQLRYRHCVGVAQWAQTLAAEHHINSQQAYLAGLLHDCARTLHPDNLYETLRGYRGKYFDEATKANPSLWHNPGGLMLAKRDYAITNPYILRAIALHSTGAVGMRPLDKIIYVADYSEPHRAFSHAKLIRQAALQDLDQAVYLTVKYKVAYLQKAKKAIHPRTIALAKSLGIQVK